MGFGARLPAGRTELRQAAERDGEEAWVGSKAWRYEIKETGSYIEEIEGQTKAVMQIAASLYLT